MQIMLRKLARNYTHSTLIIHPVIGRNLNENDLYDSEEALGLVKAANFKPISLGNINKFSENGYELGKTNENTNFEFVRLGDEVEQIHQDFILEGFKKESKYFQGDLYYEFDLSSSEEEEIQDEWSIGEIKRQFASECLLKVRNMSTSHFLGRGKIEEIGQKMGEFDLDSVFINDNLSFVQKKNLENIWNVYKVIDRFELILHIFSQRTNTKLSQAQLSLVYIDYINSKIGKEGGLSLASFDSLKNIDIFQDLNQSFTVSAKQRGGGVKSGEGERQKDLERNELGFFASKIRKIIEEEEKKENEKITHGIDRNSDISVAFVIYYTFYNSKSIKLGYTNVGKSALLSTISNSEKKLNSKDQLFTSKDRLFETLSAKKRSIHLDNNISIDAIDTIGFISNLPTQLVPTFSSSLKVLNSVDILVLVLDISHPKCLEQFATVLQTLETTGFSKNEILDRSVLVLNKLDLLETSANEKIEDVQEFIKNYFKIKSEQIGDSMKMVCTDAIHNLGVKNLKNLLIDKVTSIKSVELRYLQFQAEDLDLRLNWIEKVLNSRIYENLEYEFNEDDTVGLYLPMDEETYYRYLKVFEPKLYQQINLITSKLNDK